MTWNSLNFSTTANSTARIPYFQTVIDSIQPDILVMQEIQNTAGAHQFHNKVLNYDMEMAPFIDGHGSDNALYYNAEKFTAVENIPIKTALRDISQFVMVHLPTGDTLRIFSVHLKASKGAVNREKRLAEIDSLRKVTDALHAGAHYMVCGDFNFYSDSEPAYLRLLDDENEVGYFIDPIEMPGNWNQPQYAKYHTQSPRKRQFGGGASGGMDDRFDLILFSPHFFNPDGNITYEPESTWPVGNDGMHYNDSVNAMPNTSVSQHMANALHYASDHLPVIAQINFNHQPVHAAHVSKAENVKIYPNPSRGIFNIKLPHDHELFITLTDAVGRIIHREVIFGNSTIELSHMSSGMYFLQIEHIKGNTVYRLIKE